MCWGDMRNLVNKITEGVLWAFLACSDVMGIFWEIKPKSQTVSTRTRFSWAPGDVKDEGSVFLPWENELCVYLKGQITDFIIWVEQASMALASPHGCVLLQRGGEMQAPLIIAVACLISCALHWKITSYYLTKIRFRKNLGSQEHVQLTFFLGEQVSWDLHHLTDKIKDREKGLPSGHIWCAQPWDQYTAPHNEVLSKHPYSFYTPIRKNPVI